MKQSDFYKITHTYIKKMLPEVFCVRVSYSIIGFDFMSKSS